MVTFNCLDGSTDTVLYCSGGEARVAVEPGGAEGGRHGVTLVTWLRSTTSNGCRCGEADSVICQGSWI